MTNERELKCAERVQGQWEGTKESLERFMNANDEATYGEYREYALSFDYVAPNTWADQPIGYWRYQMSWGGPSDEIRFWSDGRGGFDRAEYWFLDWFDGAHIDVTDEPCVAWLWSDLDGIGAIDSSYEQATEG